MTDSPWQDDACSLVDAFRAGERSPLEELDASYAAIEASELNCFSHLDPERARALATQADLTLPFGGVPTGIKELESVEGWPATAGSLVFADHIADHTSNHLRRLFERGGANPVGLTTSSEFGGLNVSVTKLNGVAHNPWRHGRTAGGSSGGSCASLSGGLVSLATGGDGGGSIRIPAGYCGLLGMKGTFGRITRGPNAYARPNTVVFGNPSRSVRDAARFYDVCAGVDRHDPSTIPSPGGWEQGLGSQDLSGLKVAVVPNLGGVALAPGMAERIHDEADLLIAEAGLVKVDLDVRPPNLTAQWMMGNMATLLAELGDAWPRCAPMLTGEIAIGLFLAQSMYNLNTAAAAEKLRVQANEAMADAFDRVDLIIAATNPGPAFAAESTTSNEDDDLLDRVQANAVSRGAARSVLGLNRMMASVVPSLPSRILEAAAKRLPDVVNMGALTIISNIYGNPAVSIPAGTIDGLPVGMQVLAPHHHDARLFDVALTVERNRPWPRVAPAVGQTGTAATGAASSSDPA